MEVTLAQLDGQEKNHRRLIKLVEEFRKHPELSDVCRSIDAMLRDVDEWREMNGLPKLKSN